VSPLADKETERAVRIVVSGHVQGVGFRPFIYRTAAANGLRGHVLNKVGEVEILVAGSAARINQFTEQVVADAPPLAKPFIESVRSTPLPADTGFTIADSAAGADAHIFVPPDYFMCDDCRSELEDPADRRYRYPFINCTQCGPRYTLIEALPYDRPNTSMSGFSLCEACREEYEDPADRRFHAEPVACRACGPQVSFGRSGSDASLTGEAAIDAAVDALANDHIVAVKGVGGYHLVCDARSGAAVDRLRERKRRPDKPFAVMFPLEGSDGLAATSRAVELADFEADALTGPARPILLARSRSSAHIATNVAPGLAELGVFLPYTPLHQLLLSGFGAPLVATSGNISGEPVLTDNDEATRRLDGIADAFLHHDRPIVRPADDPVLRGIAGRVRPLRTGRGTAPVEIRLPYRLEAPVLAVGGHMKGTVALGWDDRAVVSPHIGEMDSPRSMKVFEAVAGDLQSLYGVDAMSVACDAHPGYSTHRWAKERSGLPVTMAWHHHAHASALAAEHDADAAWLVFTWDGVGLGPDGTLWGGDALAGRPGGWQRVASFRPFRLPGGERAGREPWRSAAALMWECGSDLADSPDTDGILKKAWQGGVNAPQTSAVGRLFDAASTLVCDIQHASFEAQGPMQLEALCRKTGEAVPLPLATNKDGLLVCDWSPLLPVLADDSRSSSERADAFHTSLARSLVDQALAIRQRSTFDCIGLAGGVFQNRVLTERVCSLAEDEGLDVRLSLALPCNDAAISYGQLVEVAAGDR
jgi:hydrogenase maturation protein HypF